MTLAQIMRLALCQLDEDPADIADYDERFRMYANDGYHILQREYLKPIETFSVTTDWNGDADVRDRHVTDIISVKDGDGRDVYWYKDISGQFVHTSRADATLHVTSHVEYPPLEKMDDEPKIPEHGHSALVDYICFRFLQTGNMAKQSRSQAYQSSFYTTARRIRSENRGAMTHMVGLYEASDVRSRW